MSFLKAHGGVVRGEVIDMQFVVKLEKTVHEKLANLRTLSTYLSLLDDSQHIIIETNAMLQNNIFFFRYKFVFCKLWVVDIYRNNLRFVRKEVEFGPGVADATTQNEI